jgi:hypothetical protein
VWKHEHWHALGISAIDGAIVGFIIGFAANINIAEFVTAFVADLPGRAVIFTIGGALIAVAVNLIFLSFTSRSAIEGVSQ